MLDARQGKILKDLIDAKVIEAGGVSFDTVPTKGSTNPVTSNGIKEAMDEQAESINSNTGVNDYPVFSASEAYSKGKVVNYNGKLYKFTADHAAGAWTGSDVEEYSLKKLVDLCKIVEYELTASSTYIPNSNVTDGDYVYVKVIENPSSAQIVVSSLNEYAIVETIYNSTLLNEVLFKCTKTAEKVQIYCANYSEVVVKVGILKKDNISNLLEKQIQELKDTQNDTNTNLGNLSDRIDSAYFSKKDFTFTGNYLNLDTDGIKGLHVLFLLNSDNKNKDLNIECKLEEEGSFGSASTINEYNPFAYLHIEDGQYRIHNVQTNLETSISVIVNPNIRTLKRYSTRLLDNISIVKGTVDNDTEKYKDDEYYARTGLIYYKLKFLDEDWSSRRYLVIFPDEYICVLNYYVDNILTSYENYIPFSFSTRSYKGAVLTFKKKDGSTITDNDISELNENVKLYIHENYNENYDLVIAANDTPYRFKKLADIVLNGENDNEILQAAIGSIDDIKILLYPGTYNVSKQYVTKYRQKGSFFTNENVINDRTKNIQIDGYYELSRYTYTGVVKLVTTTKLYNTIKSGNEEHSIIAVTRMGEALDTQNLSRTSIVIKNISFVSDKYDAPIRFVDMIHASSCYLNGVTVFADKDYSPSNLVNFANEPNSKLVGIAVGYGSNNGIANKVEHCLIMYCYTGVQCCGEHYIFEDVLTHHCINGFEFGTRLTRGNYEHPNIMLGCSIEGCYRLMLLSSYGETEESETWSSKNTLICIGLSIEGSWGGYGSSGEGKGTTLPIKEIIKGLYRGYISADGFAKKGGGIFEQDGSGKCMQWKSYLSWHSQSYGTQKPLATYVMPGTVFMDTSNGKPIFSTGEKWVNSDGTDA